MSASWLHRCGELVRERPREAGAASAGALIIVIIVSLVLAPSQPLAPGPTTVVRIGSFAESLVETGTIAASRFRTYGSKIAGGPAKIVEIVREGAAVETGDILVRFDAGAFEQELERERGALRQAVAERNGAIEDLRLMQLSSATEIQNAEQQVDTARTDLANQDLGQGRLAIAEAEVALGNAQREVERALDTYEDLQPLLEKGFITRVELDQSRRDWERAVEQESLSEMRMRTLLEFDRPAALNQARARVDSAEDDLGRREESVDSRAIQLQASLDRANGRIQEVTARIALLEEKIANTTLRAENAGLVVHRYLFFGSERRRAQVGDEVWPNQAIIALPDASELIVETTIREVDLHKISTSQRVTVTVDAYPDVELPATVELVGALAQENPNRAGTKFFPVTVKLSEVDDRLRTGMTARVKIEVASIEEAMIAPTQAVFESDGQRYCLVFRGGQIERRLVSVVAVSLKNAVLQGNVEAGDVLLLSPSVGDDGAPRVP